MEKMIRFFALTREKPRESIGFSGVFDLSCGIKNLHANRNYNKLLYYLSNFQGVHSTTTKSISLE